MDGAGGADCGEKMNGGGLIQLRMVKIGGHLDLQRTPWTFSVHLEQQ